MSISSSPISRTSSWSRLPLGQQLLQAGHLDQAQVSRILQDQAESDLRFGELCLRDNLVPPSKLYLFVDCESLQLGELLVLYGFINFQQMEDALVLQKKWHQPLGETLVRKQLLSPEILDWVLKEQSYFHQMGQKRAWDVLQARLTQTNQIREHLQKLLRKRQASGQDPQPTKPPTPVVPVVRQRPAPSEATPLIEPQAVDWLDDRKPERRASEHSLLMVKVESLELQLSQKEEEFADYYEQVEHQISQYQTQYAERIRFLEEQLQQKSELCSIKDRMCEDYQARINQLESELWRQNEKLKYQSQQDEGEQKLRSHITELQTELKAATRLEKKYEAMLLKQQEKLLDAQDQIERQTEQIESLQDQMKANGSQNVVPMRKSEIVASSPSGSKYTISPSASYQLQQIIRRQDKLLIPLSLINLRDQFDISYILSTLYSTEAEVTEQANRLESLLQVHRRESRRNSSSRAQVEQQIFRLLGLHHQGNQEPSSPGSFHQM